MLKLTNKALILSVLFLIFLFFHFKSKARDTDEAPNIKENEKTLGEKFYDTPMAQPPENSITGWMGAFGLESEVPKSEWR